MKMLHLIIIVLSTWPLFAQPCQCKGVVDGAQASSVALYDMPNGYPMGPISANVAGEEYLVFTLLEVQKGFFKVEIGLTSDEKNTQAWIKAADYLGTYANNYGGQPLKLYQSADKKSAVAATVNKYYPQLYTITDCKGAWAKVKLTAEGKTYEGWLEPAMQCANPHANCN